jgi:hypothetical protein
MEATGMTRLIELGLRAWAIVLVACAGLWVLVGGLGLWQTINVLPWSWTVIGPLRGIRAGLTVEAQDRDLGVLASLSEGLERVVDREAHNAAVAQGDQQAFAEITLTLQAQMTGLPLWQEAAFITVNVIALLVTAWLWWSLADVVRNSRGGHIFTRHTARLLTAAGVVLLVGTPTLTLIHWGLGSWALSTSSLADKIAMPQFGLLSLPWSMMAVGLALLILGRVWHRGARLEWEVQGMV